MSFFKTYFLHFICNIFAFCAQHYIKQICNKINKIYPSGNQKDDWLWRQIFKSETINIGDEINKDEIFKFLDSCMEEILKFEKILKDKLNETV